MKLSRRPFVDVNEVIFKSVISQVDLDCTRRLRALALSSLPVVGPSCTGRDAQLGVPAQCMLTAAIGRTMVWIGFSVRLSHYESVGSMDAAGSRGCAAWYQRKQKASPKTFA